MVKEDTFTRGMWVPDIFLICDGVAGSTGRVSDV